jgi:hypothetical protein
LKIFFLNEEMLGNRNNVTIWEAKYSFKKGLIIAKLRQKIFKIKSPEEIYHRDFSFECNFVLYFRRG